MNRHGRVDGRRSSVKLLSPVASRMGDDSIAGLLSLAGTTTRGKDVSGRGRSRRQSVDTGTCKKDRRSRSNGNNRFSATLTDLSIVERVIAGVAGVGNLRLTAEGLKEGSAMLDADTVLKETCAANVSEAASRLAGDTILMERSVALGVSHKALAGVRRTAHVVRHDDDEVDDKVKRCEKEISVMLTLLGSEPRYLKLEGLS